MALHTLTNSMTSSWRPPFSYLDTVVVVGLGLVHAFGDVCAFGVHDLIHVHDPACTAASGGETGALPG